VDSRARPGREEERATWARKQRAARNAEATARRIEEERQERASLPRTHLR
jgi:hypothetical protein